jgi:hypothetical protein
MNGVNKWVFWIVTIALIIDVTLFLGIGFSVGALAVTGQAQQGSYSFQVANEGQNYGDGMSFNVQMINVNNTGNLPISSMLPGHESTEITFGVYLYSHGDCGNTAQPVWAPGTGADYGYYTIQYLVGGSPYVFTAEVGNTAQSGTYTGTTIGGNTAPELNANTTSSISGPAFCIVNNGADAVSANLQTAQAGPGQASQPAANFVDTMYLIGDYPLGDLVISFHSWVTFCDGGLSGYYAVCNAASSALIQNDFFFNWDNAATGGTALVATATAPVQSAIGTVTVVNKGNLAYNNGKITVDVSTGYAGATAYEVSLLCPQPRTPANGGCTGGQNDSRFGSQQVPNNEQSYPVTWSVPAGTSQDVNQTGWNTWEVELYNGLFDQGFAPVTINIAQPNTPQGQNNPPAVGFTFSTNGTFYYPEVGNTLTLTVFANASNSNSSAAITGISLWVYYLPLSGNPVNEPQCGAQWVTSGCPYSEALSGSQLVQSGSGMIGTFTFQVEPPRIGAMIGGLIESFNHGQQGSPILPFLIQITPTGCQPGMPGCPPNHFGLTFWEIAGPILLSLGIMLGAIWIALFLIPKKFRTTKVLVVVAAGVIVALLYVLGADVSWFAAGGILNSGVIK